MRIAIVNDTPLAVEGLRRVLQGSGAHSIAWIAWNGLEAVERCAVDRPDLILMDLVMPELGGGEAIRRIMQSSPCPILVVTASVNENTSLVFEALGAGALDAVNTPVLSQVNGQTMGGNELLEKVSRIGLLTAAPKAAHMAHATHWPTAEKIQDDNPLVLLGSSSGGPQAVAKCLAVLPQDFPAPIIVVQHLDEKFSPGLAEWLNSQTQLDVRLAKENDRPAPGQVFVAGRNEHLVMREHGRLDYSNTPEEVIYRPSVDVFWQSVAQNWQGSVIAVLLTGMGRDGANGMLALRQSGAFTVAQDEHSCAVFGMPKAAIELDAAMSVLPLEEMGSMLMKKLQS